ncbi:MAG: hypothetical protein ACXADY_02895 [Candidatus Hodarchaeales archaeon]|jgi:hypothetical protein
MSEEAWISFWESIITTIITTLVTLFAVYLTYWLVQTREKNVKFTKTVFEPLHTDILEITNLAKSFDFKRSSLETGAKYSPARKSKTWAKFSTDANLNLQFLNVTQRRKRDIKGLFLGKDLKKEIEDFYECFENYQDNCWFVWPTVEEDIQNYLRKPTNQKLLEDINIKVEESLIDEFITNLKEEDKKKRHSNIGRSYGITKISIIEEMIEDINSILCQQDYFQEMISLKNELITKGQALIEELRKRMVY